MKILFTTPVLEHPAAGGPQLRIENSILALNRVSELFIVSRVEKNKLGGEKAEQFYKDNCREFVYAPSIKGLSNMRSIRIVQRLFNLFFRIGDADFVLKCVDRFKIDIVWFGYGNISYGLMKKIKAVRPQIKVVCDTDSVWSRFVLRELPYENDPRRRKKIERIGKLKEHEEQGWVNLCDITTAVSEVDAEYYRGLAVDTYRIKLFSNVINLDTYSGNVSPPEGFNKPCIFLAGTFGPKSPMDRAARWVVSEVLPIVRKTIPDIHFYIVGRDSDKTLRDVCEQGITITGKLDSVLPYLCNTDVSIVPLFFESGTRFKILEAAACKIPIVSTSLGAEGLDLIDSEHILIADDPVTFANHIINIINDKKLADNLSENCNRIVRQNYSLNTLISDAEYILKHLSN